MSPRKRSTTTMDPPVAELVTDPTEALKRRAHQLFTSALETYRQAVFAAAAANGQIPESKVDAVVEACQVAGIPVEQFADDVETIRNRDNARKSAEAIETKRHASATEAAEMWREIENLEADVKAKKERHRQVVSMDRTFAETMRTVNDMETRSPWLFLDAASVTPELVRKKLTTRAYFAR